MSEGGGAAGVGKKRSSGSGEEEEQPGAGANMQNVPLRLGRHQAATARELSLLLLPYKGAKGAKDFLEICWILCQSPAER